MFPRVVGLQPPLVIGMDGVNAVTLEPNQVIPYRPKYLYTAVGESPTSSTAPMSSSWVH